MATTPPPAPPPETPPPITEDSSPLATLEAAFWWVGAALRIHGRFNGELPNRPVTLHHLRVRMASPGLSSQTRALVWSYVVRHARARGPRQSDWTIAAAGLALPSLVRIVGALTRPDRHHPRIDPLHYQAAALGGFYTELRRPDLSVHDALLARRLNMSAYRAARTLRDCGPLWHPPATTTPPSAQSATAPEVTP